MSTVHNRLIFSSSHRQQQFDDYGLGQFDALWELQAETVEPANVRRGGWSSVVRFEAVDGAAFYLKRQENHDFRDWRNRPWQSTPTVAREWQAGIDFRAMGVGTAEPICLGIDQTDASRGLLVTAALDEHVDLPAVLQSGLLDQAARRALWEALADNVRRIHDHGYRHNCLYGHHVLVQRRGEGWDVAMIDLEKASRTRRLDRATISDLSALDRHTDDMSQRDRYWLWDRYFKDVPLPQRRRILLVLARRSSVKGVDHYIRDCEAGRRG